MIHPSLDAATFKAPVRTPFAQPPWSAQGRSQWSGFRIVDAHGRGICNFPQREHQNDAQREATAALMAAAPGLLHSMQTIELLISMASVGHENGLTAEETATVLRIAQAAIKGAKP